MCSSTRVLLQISERVLGVDHPAPLINGNSLASVLHVQRDANDRCWIRTSVAVRRSYQEAADGLQHADDQGQHGTHSHRPANFLSDSPTASHADRG